MYKLSIFLILVCLYLAFAHDLAQRPVALSFDDIPEPRKAAAHIEPTQAVPVAKAKRTSTGWEIDSIKLPANKGNFATWYPVPKKDDVSIVFDVKGRVGGAQIRLSPPTSKLRGSNSGKCTDCIDINIGSVGNTAVDIVYGWMKVNSQYINPLYNGRVTNGQKYRTFWVNWRGDSGGAGEISVGFGPNVYRNIIISYRDDALQQYFNWTSIKGGRPFLDNIQFISFASWTHAVEFKNVRIGHSYVARSTSQSATVTNYGLAYIQFHYAQRMWELNSKNFELVFEAQGLSEVIIGFLRDFRFRGGSDDRGYEVLLEEAFERGAHPRSVITFGTGHGNMVIAKTSVNNLVSSSQFRPFWIRLENSTFAVGKGLEVGKHVIMETDEPVPPTGTDTVWLSTSSYFFSSSVRFLSIKSRNVKSSKDDGKIITVDWQDTTPYQPDRSDLPAISLKTGTDSPYQPYLGSEKCDDKACEGPDLRYSQQVLTVQPRYQWWHHGAYCGELAVQSIALSYGVYLSQKAIRLVTPYNNRPWTYGNPTEGYELTDYNFGQVLTKLGLKYEEWDRDTPAPQAVPYLRWLKHHVVRRHPVAMMVRFFEGTSYDHIEAVWGYQSSRPLTDPNIYYDDYIGWNTGLGIKRNWRQIGTLYDTNDVATALDKNRAGNNCTRSTQECIFNHHNYGFAITGLRDPRRRSIPTSIRVNDNGYEPTPPFVIQTTANVTVDGPLVVGQKYRIFRYNDWSDLPMDSDFEEGWTYFKDFVATSTTYNWVDPRSFPSDSSKYYVTIRIPSSPSSTVDHTDTDHEEEAEEEEEKHSIAPTAKTGKLGKATVKTTLSIQDQLVECARLRDEYTTDDPVISQCYDQVDRLVARYPRSSIVAAQGRSCHRLRERTSAQSPAIPMCYRKIANMIGYSFYEQ